MSLPVFHKKFTVADKEYAADSSFLNAPLLVDSGSPHSELTVDDYFESINAFLKIHLKEVLPESTAAQSISITSIKMGAFYHVARIDIMLNTSPIHFAINTAFSGHGRRCMQQDQLILSQFTENPWIPSPLAYDSVLINKEGIDYPFNHLLVEWFEDFHEWHATDNDKIILWDSLRGNRLLNDDQVINLFYLMTKILVLAYDYDQKKAIGNWYNAAGDFILKTNEHGCELRLVTIRTFAPLDFIGDAVNPLIALLYCFLDITIRMHLDKKNGVDETVWLTFPLKETLFAGFFDGMKEKELNGLCPPGTTMTMRDLLASMGREEMQTAAQPLLDLYEREMTFSDFSLVTEHIENCIEQICTIFNQ